LKAKSLLPFLYKREELPLFDKEGRGEIFGTKVFFIMEFLGIAPLGFLTGFTS
jgi:hypothetical protein